MEDVQGNLLEQINNDFFQINNKEKECKRKKKQWTCVFGMIFFIMELVINGKCLITASELPPLVYIDLICYVGLTIIGIIEIYLLQKKMSKQKKEYIKKRARFGVLLYIYYCLTVIMFLLLIIHTFFQLYFGIIKFDQECFYLHYKISSQVWFTVLKIVLLIFFIGIEISIFVFLYDVMQQNFNTIKNPYKKIDTMQNTTTDVFQSSIFK